LENTTVIDYCGVIQYETIGELIHKFKHQIHIMGVQIGTYKRILLVMIESLEYIIKYSERPPDKIIDDQLYAPAFSITKNENHYTIIASNPVKKQVFSSLKNKLDHLNSLDQQGLKDFYKETITNGEFTNKGGAGLGLIELAKISGNIIKYEFYPIDKKYLRFTQYITIDESQS
jgi:hypothetical protein